MSDARQKVIDQLRWLADARGEYEETERDTSVARHLAAILEGTNDAAGWLPSWRWDEWDEMRGVKRDY